MRDRSPDHAETTETAPRVRRAQPDDSGIAVIAGEAPGGAGGINGRNGGNDDDDATVAAPARVSRRQALGVAAAVGAGVALAPHVPGNRMAPGVLGLGQRRSRAPDRPADGGAFASRDDSYAKAAGQISAEAAPPPTLLYDTASEAAAGTVVTVPTILATGDPVVHLLRRASFGPTPALADEVHEVGIDAWLDQQLAPESLPDDVADAAWETFPLADTDPATIRASLPQYSWDATISTGRATMARQVWSRRQLYEVMVDFWANHLNVPTPGVGQWDVGGRYQIDVIRANALGSFPDMLVASARHPAMLRYLSGGESTRQSVNENYGREVLELHTVGVGSCYTEDDVRNSAYVLTGRTVGGDHGMGPVSTFVYDPAKHWTGPVQVLDFAHENASAAGGLDLGDEYLRHLAGLPATAQTIARKLAVRFVADVPPQTLIDRLAQAYLDNGGQTVPVLQIMFRSAEFWAAVGQKVRRPLENVVASARAIGVQPGPDNVKGVDFLYRSATGMGHRPMAWVAPNGYPDVHAAWRSAGGLVSIWNYHWQLVKQWGEGLTYRPLADIGASGGNAVPDRVDAVCQELCLQTFQPAHRDALIAFVGAGPAKPDELIPLVLDTPYFALR
jgi:uncharacterized protein (DUF1800 family)